MIASKIKRGSAEFAILSVLAEERLYGYQIAQTIAERTAGELRVLVGRLSRRLRQSYTEDEITLSQASVLKRWKRDRRNAEHRPWNHERRVAGRSQANRSRDAIYGYLSALYALVTWWAADRQDVARARRAVRLSGLDVVAQENPFAAVIRCTADAAKAKAPIVNQVFNKKTDKSKAHKKSTAR